MSPSDRKLRANLICIASTYPAQSKERRQLLDLVRVADEEQVPSPPYFDESETFPADEIAEEKPGPLLEVDPTPQSSADVAGEFTQQEYSELGDRIEGDDIGNDAKMASRKQAGMVRVRKPVTIAVRVLQQREDLNFGGLNVLGQMSIDFGSGLGSFRFVARIENIEGTWTVLSFAPQKSVSGAGAEVVLKILESALTEALAKGGDQLLGSAEEMIMASKKADFDPNEIGDEEAPAQHDKDESYMKVFTQDEHSEMLETEQKDQWGKVKAFLVRKAHAHPELRKAALEFIAGCEKLPEGPMRDNCEGKDKSNDNDGKDKDKAKDDGKMPKELLEKFKGKKAEAIKAATAKATSKKEAATTAYQTARALGYSAEAALAAGKAAATNFGKKQV